MRTSKRRPPSPGRQPWDPANGLRVGILAGGFVGAGVIALTGIASFWIVAAFAAIGGAIGYWSEKRAQ